jgi:hypothetical protein
MNWIEQARDSDILQALVNAVINLLFPENTGNFLTSCKPSSFSRTTLLHGVSKYVAKIRLVEVGYRQLFQARALCFITRVVDRIFAQMLSVYDIW